MVRPSPYYYIYAFTSDYTIYFRRSSAYLTDLDFVSHRYYTLANPTAPVTVYVLEQGIHSSLVLPDRTDGLIQYAYGGWNYFALNQQDWDALAALLIPTQGALGHRKVSNIDQLWQTFNQEDETLLSFAVEKAEATKLLQSLNEHFNHNINTQVENSLTGLTLVKDDQDYTLLHNSNYEIVTWLKDLECEVEGFVILPDFQVKYPKNYYRKVSVTYPI